MIPRRRSRHRALKSTPSTTRQRGRWRLLPRPATEEGGLLVIIGDVAGKGLKAAMNVSMLMGALRRTPERSPARILESLNACSPVARVSPPARLPSSAPMAKSSWPTPATCRLISTARKSPCPVACRLGFWMTTLTRVRLYLHPGDRILLMSDGVVEARQPSGELFGFERVHNLTGQSAFYIADPPKPSARRTTSPSSPSAASPGHGRVNNSRTHGARKEISRALQFIPHLRSTIKKGRARPLQKSPSRRKKQANFRIFSHLNENKHVTYEMAHFDPLNKALT